MRVKKTDFREVSKNSMNRDFNRNKRESETRKRDKRDDTVKRISEINPSSFYAKFSRYLVGKKVKIHYAHPDSGNKVMVSFIFEEDRQALNKAADWSNEKTEYLLDGVKFR